MSNEVRINCDDAALDCRTQINNARAYVSAQDETLDYSSGFMAVARAFSIASFVLDNLDPRLELERERFRDFRTEARKLIELYWKRFRFSAMPLPNGNTVALREKQPEEARKPIATPNLPAATNSATKPYKSRRGKRLPTTIIVSIKRAAKRYGKPFRMSYSREIADELNRQGIQIAASTVYNIATGLSHKDVQA